MRITNIANFRNDLYTALQDTQLVVEHSTATWKNGIEYKETMKEFNHYDADGNIISLAQPIKIIGEESNIYLTVDEDGVDFYRSRENCFEWAGSCSFEYFRNRLSFTMEVVIRIVHHVNA